MARSATAHGHPEEAIAAVQRHARKWPAGYLSEEREVIWIQALVAAGRRDEAEKKAADFRHAYPHSAMEGAVDAALATSNSQMHVTDSGIQ